MPKTITTTQLVKELGQCLDRYTELEQWFDGLNLMRETDRGALIELQRKQVELLHDVAHWSGELLKAEHDSNTV